MRSIVIHSKLCNLTLFMRLFMLGSCNSNSLYLASSVTKKLKKIKKNKNKEKNPTTF